METTIDNKNAMSGSGQRRIALVAGFGLLPMVVALGLAEAFAMAQIVVSGDAAATIANITTKMSLFRFGIFSHVIVITLDLIVAWALYIYLKPLGKPLYLLAAWARVLLPCFTAWPWSTTSS